MKHYFYKIGLFLFIISALNCARKGTITGGLKDTLAPVLKNSLPKNFSTEFTGNKIVLQFDEFVKIKDVNKQLIVSPPLKYLPEILPLTPSKTISIRLKDTLLPNTTYSFNFGNSIEDNNEGNVLEQFKYVFSTGKSIDSLRLKVAVKDALQLKTDQYVSIMLYEKDENYTDSIIYKTPPRYIGNTLDSIKTVTLENLKPGKYRLIAIKDVNRNNKYDPKVDKIGFEEDFISIPDDKTYKLKLFKETPAFKTLNFSQTSGSRFTIGYQGNEKGTEISVKKSNIEIPHRVTKIPDKDSLQLWFKASKEDSLNISVKNGAFTKTHNLKIKNQKTDTLAITSKKQGTLHYREKLILNTSTPIENWDLAQIQLTKKDKSKVIYSLLNNSYNQQLEINFAREPEEEYELKLLPKSLIDFYGNTNRDTLSFKYKTLPISEYGNLVVKLEKAKRFPVLVELTNTEGKVIATEYSESSTKIQFDGLEPAVYTMRLIYDDNKNKKWDAGNFLDKKQSEEVIYFSKPIDIRANWDVEQPFVLD